MRFPIRLLIALFGFSHFLPMPRRSAGTGKAFLFRQLGRIRPGGVSFQIAKDYYLYRGSLKFSAGFRLNWEPALPAGKIKQDDTCRVETYRATCFPHSRDLPAARRSRST